MESSCKGTDQDMDISVNFSSPAFVDQSSDQTLEAAEPENKTREGNDGVGCSLNVFEWVSSTRGRDPGKVEGMLAAFWFI